MFFLGTFDYAMDERGRVPLPPRYRDAFRGGIVLGQGSPDPCVRVYTMDAFEAQAQRYTQASSMRKKGMDLRRVLFATAHHAQLDAQSRILVPPPLRSYARLHGKVLMIGTGEWLELWDPDRYGEEMRRVDDTLETTMESMDEWNR